MWVASFESVLRCVDLCGGVGDCSAITKVVCMNSIICRDSIVTCRMQQVLHRFYTAACFTLGVGGILGSGTEMEKQ